nr:EOG090X09MN [Eurycercus lamellatus]
MILCKNDLITWTLIIFKSVIDHITQHITIWIKEKNVYYDGILVKTLSLIWICFRQTKKLVLEMKCVVLMEEESGGILKSSKMVLHLSPFENAHHPKVVAKSSASFIKMAFSDGGFSAMKNCLAKVLSDRLWEKLPSQLPNLSIKSAGQSVAARSGIVGIERKMQEKMENTASNISLAFQDLQNLMDMAKDMVRLANVMSNKIKDRQGEISEDETVKFKSYLLSLGIEDPVTREAYSTSDAYRKQLAKQISEFLLGQISDIGGLMALSDAYCRVNRARGFELLSPEDFLQACRQMKELNLPIKLRTFESGVFVLQLQSQADTQFDLETAKLLEEKQKLTAFEMSQVLGISVLLAAERLHAAEKAGLACRDDSVRGLVFYPNLFLHSNSLNIKNYE